MIDLPSGSGCTGINIDEDDLRSRRARTEIPEGDKLERDARFVTGELCMDAVVIRPFAEVQIIRGQVKRLQRDVFRIPERLIVRADTDIIPCALGLYKSKSVHARCPFKRPAVPIVCDLSVLYAALSERDAEDLVALDAQEGIRYVERDHGCGRAVFQTVDKR